MPNSPLSLRLESKKSRALVSETLEIHVVLENRGTAAVEVPDPFHADNAQPIYTVTGPECPQGRSFSFRTAVSDDKRLDPAGVKPVLAKVDAGKALEGDIPLHQWAALATPGDYTLVAELDFGALAAKSNALRFTLEAPAVQSFSVGVNVGVAGASRIPFAFLQGGAAPRVYEGLWFEQRADLGEARLHSLAPMGTAASGAADVRVPWSNYDRQSELVRWTVWREGTSVVAQPGFAEKPRRLTIDGAARIVRPALMVAPGVLYALTLSSDGRQWTLAHFPVSGDPRIAARGTLQLAAVSARAALGPPPSNARRAVFVAQSDDALVLSTLDLAAAAPALVEAARVPKCSAIAGVEPAVAFDEQGRCTITLLVRRQGASAAKLVCLDVATDARGAAAASPALIEIGDLPRIRAGAAAFKATPGGPPRRDWAVLLESGEVLSSFAPQEARRTAFAPAVPLELVALSRAGYLVTLDPARGPQLEALH